MTSPRTLVQSILLSSSSSTSPHIVMLSPRTRNRPCCSSALGSSSSAGRMIRSTVSLKTTFVTWSQESSVPTSVRPSTVIISTFSEVCQRSSPSTSGRRYILSMYVERDMVANHAPQEVSCDGDDLIQRAKRSGYLHILSILLAKRHATVGCTSTRTFEVVLLPTPGTALPCSLAAFRQPRGHPSLSLLLSSTVPQFVLQSRH